MTRLLQTLLLGAALSTLSGCGKNPPATPAPAAAPEPVVQAPEATAQAPAPTAGDATATVALGDGEGTFKKACALCHQTGAGGAPKAGDKEEWAPRIAQGMATLHEHSLKGFNGAKGIMPAKGGNPTLTDADVLAAVDYGDAVTVGECGARAGRYILWSCSAPPSSATRSGVIWLKRSTVPPNCLTKVSASSEGEGSVGLWRQICAAVDVIGELRVDQLPCRFSHPVLPMSCTYSAVTTHLLDADRSKQFHRAQNSGEPLS